MEMSWNVVSVYPGSYCGVKCNQGLHFSAINRGGTRVSFGWVCVAQASKFGPRSRTVMDSKSYPALEISNFSCRVVLDIN